MMAVPFPGCLLSFFGCLADGLIFLIRPCFGGAEAWLVACEPPVAPVDLAFSLVFAILLRWSEDQIVKFVFMGREKGSKIRVKYKRDDVGLLELMLCSQKVAHEKLRIAVATYLECQMAKIDMYVVFLHRRVSGILDPKYMDHFGESRLKKQLSPSEDQAPNIHA